MLKFEFCVTWTFVFQNACRFFYLLLITWMTCFHQTPCYAESYQMLKLNDVDRVMKQIFNKHVDKKEITAAILQNSFKVYINQFDPERIYLLEEEVRPYLQMSDVDKEHILDQYKQHQFPEYSQLNNLIQKAIQRSRKIRETFEKRNASQLLQQSLSYNPEGYEEWRDPDLNRFFPKNEEALNKRIQHAFLNFIAAERKRYGNAYVQEKSNNIIRLFERNARHHENQYLFIKENGQPMSDAEKQNAFAMHILKSLASSLDAHTSILNPAEAYDMRIRLEKEIDSVGIEVQISNGNYIISYVIPDSPAAKNGQIKQGDQLLKIDGIDLKDKTLNEVVEMIQGKKGSLVTLQIKSLTKSSQILPNIFDVTLTREEIVVDDDRAQARFEPYKNGIIGIIKLDSFYQGDHGISSEGDLRSAIKDLDRHGNLQGLILDLRENSGGFLSQAVKVVGLFITNGVVVISKYFNGEEHVYRDMESQKVYDGPMIILTSKATASAAEIVAQALQDYGIAVIVGDEHTYGKGTIQSQTVTEGHASAYFKVTVGTYYTVSGKTPQMKGVIADVIVPSQFVHENMGEEYLDYPLQQDTIPPSFEDKLQDIAPNLKPWYMRYYAPTIQHKKNLWSGALPVLKRNSAHRIAQNPNYQLFLSGQTSSVPAKDLQLNEALSIMKDMIDFQLTHRTH